MTCSAAAVAWLRGPYTRAAIGRMAWSVQDPALDTFAGGELHTSSSLSFEFQNACWKALGHEPLCTA